MKEPKEFLKKFRKENKLTQPKLGELIGVTQQYVSLVENGKNKIGDDLLEIFKKIMNEKEYSEFEEAVLFDRLPEKIKNKINERVEVKGNAHILPGQEELSMLELPVYGKASAGNGYINFEEVIRFEKITNIPEIDLPKGSFIIEVGGDSMFPTLLDSDLAIVKPVTDCEETDGKICVVTWNDQTFIKRVRYQKGMVILMSDNPDRSKYHDIFIEKDELQYLKCHGIVVESRRKY